MVVDGLKVEVARLYRIEGDGPTKAFADIRFADAILIKGLRVVNGEKGLFVSLPAELGKDGKWYETVRTLNRETKDALTQVVLEAYGE